MNPRGPFLLLAVVVGGGLVVGASEGARPSVARGPRPVPGLAAPVAPPADASGSTWYCAGGTAEEGGAADHTVVVANPTGHEVTGLLTIYPGQVHGPDGAGGSSDPSPSEHGFAVPAGGRSTFRLADLHAAPLAAALVELDGGGVAVEHQVTGSHGRDTAPCASGPAAAWHFAWGSTSRDARELLVLFNPFPSDVTVDARFSTEAGVREPLRWQGLAVPARSVVGVEVGADVTRRGQVAASVRVRGGGRLVVDRLQIFDGSRGPAGISLALGQPTPVSAAVFPHGRVDDRTSERMVVYNPGDRPAEVEVDVQSASADAPPSEPFGLVVRPGRVEILDYGAESRVIRADDHLTRVRSLNGVPVVAERVIAGGSELSAGPGSAFAATRWVFALVHPESGQSVRFVVANPDRDRPARVALSVSSAGEPSGTDELPAVQVPAGGRVDLDLPADRTPSTGTVVARASRPVVVERLLVQDGVPVTASPGIPQSEGLQALR